MSLRKKILTYTLRHKVSLEKKTLTPDTGGGYETAWQEVATLWVAITYLRGKENYTHGQISSSATHIFRLRYTDLIAPDMRFSYDDRIFNIRSIRIVDEKKRTLEVTVEEGVAV